MTNGSARQASAAIAPLLPPFSSPSSGVLPAPSTLQECVVLLATFFLPTSGHKEVFLGRVGQVCQQGGMKLSLLGIKMPLKE